MDNQAKTTARNTDLLLNGGGRPQKMIEASHEPLMSELILGSELKPPPGAVLLPPNPDLPPLVTIDPGVRVPPSPPKAIDAEPNTGNGTITEPKKPLKIAMVGTAPSSKGLAPFNDPSWTIWVCSPGNQDVPRADAWFEVHSNLLWPECVSYGAPYVEWLKKQKFPIYMQDTSLVPNAIPLPIQELVQEYGKYFFTSSFAYMIAMAIKAGADEIALFGIDMASKDEYILQRAGGHYFMTEAAKRGIKVAVPYESDLAQNPELYGYADSTPFGRKLHVRKKELEGRILQMSGERDKLNHSITYLQGALEDLDYIKTIWGGIQT